MRLTWPLTGRAEEMDVVTTALSPGGHRGVVIRGAYGVGKTRLAREAVSASNICETRWVVGTSSARVLPLGAFTQWLGRPAGGRERQAHDVVEALTDVPDGSTVVVAVDDAHLLDDLSLVVLRQIIARHHTRILLTAPTDATIPEPAQEIWRSGQFVRLDLQPLSQAESTRLVSAALRGEVDPDAAARLWKLTRGNVLYLRNIVEHAVSDGSFSRVDGCWRWSGATILPPGLAATIEMRIGALREAVGEVLDVLTIGGPIELAALGRITDPAAVEEADARGLVTLDDIDGRVEVRVAHPMYAELRKRGAPFTRLSRLRGMLAAELGSVPDQMSSA